MLFWLHTKANESYSHLHQILSMSTQDKVQQLDADLLPTKPQIISRQKAEEPQASPTFYIQNLPPRRQENSSVFCF